MIPWAPVETAIRVAGLSPRGAVQLGADEWPGLKSLALVGMIGSKDWPFFAASPEMRDGAPDPLDRYSLRVIGALADKLGAKALFPFGGPPYLPFLRWARRAEPLSPSPLGLMIHPRYGLWHSFRGALGFSDHLEISPTEPAVSPCEACEARPCLTACPVNAFSGQSYDVGACASHLRRPSADACLTGGCLARRSCPVGREFAQDPSQAAFHIAAFLRARD